MSNVVSQYDIFAAIRNENIAFIKAYITDKQDLEVIKDHKTPLFYATIYDEDIAFMFIEAGANIYFKKTDININLLSFALKNRSTKIAQYCIDKAFDIHEQDKFGDTAISWSIYAGNLEITTTLINMGGNINFINKNGDTAFIELLKYTWNDIVFNEKKTNMIVFLLHNNVDISIISGNYNVFDYFIINKSHYFHNYNKLDRYIYIFDLFLDIMIKNKISFNINNLTEQSEILSGKFSLEILRKIVKIANKSSIKDIVNFMISYKLIDYNELLCIPDKYGIISTFNDCK